MVTGTINTAASFTGRRQLRQLTSVLNSQTKSLAAFRKSRYRP